MCIRRATLEDAEGIRSVILCAGESGREDFSDDGWNRFINLTEIGIVRDRLQNQQILTLCYIKETDIVGVIAMRALRKIDQLFVLPQIRQQGIARELWSEARQICLRHGNDGRFRVKSSTQAIPVYETFGFTIVGNKTIQNGVSYTPMELVL